MHGRGRRQRPEGFDFGNSPHELSQAPDVDVRGKTIIQSTRGWHGRSLCRARRWTMFAASFVIAEATCRAIQQAAPELVTILAMGSRGVVRGDEDELCALYLRNRLQGRHLDAEAVMSLARCGHEADGFGSPKCPSKPTADLEMACGSTPSTSPSRYLMRMAC